MGFSPAIRGWILSGGFGSPQKTIGLSSGPEVSFRADIGLDGVLNESGDGLAFLSFGWIQDASSSIGVVDVSELNAFGNLFAETPGR